MRSSRSRATNPDVTKIFDDIGITLRNIDYRQNKSRLYYIMKRIEQGKIGIPVKDVTAGYYGFGVDNNGKLHFEISFKQNKPRGHAPR